LKVNPGGVYTADSAADEWTDATGEMTHTYSQDFIDKNLADWEIYLSSCCRISTLMKNKNSGYKVYTVVPALEFLNNKAGPSMNVFPLLTIPIQKGIVTQEIAASDPYGADNLTFAWASKKYACGCTTCSCALPNTYKGSLAINASTGALSWDTDALGKSDVGTYPVQVKVTNNKGSVSVVDFIINLIDSSPKYFCALTGTRCDKDFGCGTRSVVTKKTVSTWHYSDNKKYQNLYLASPILDVRLLQKRGAVKSLPGKNWGFTSKSIWTSGKFRGKFEVKYGKNDTAHDLTLVKKARFVFSEAYDTNVFPVFAGSSLWAYTVTNKLEPYQGAWTEYDQTRTKTGKRSSRLLSKSSRNGAKRSVTTPSKTATKCLKPLATK
jgi:hypothetical protein